MISTITDSNHSQEPGLHQRRFASRLGRSVALSVSDTVPTWPIVGKLTQVDSTQVVRAETYVLEAHTVVFLRKTSAEA